MALETKTTETPWEALTPDEKMERRFAAWRAAQGIEFVSPEAEQEYKARVARIADALQLKQPDRVPVFLNLGNFAAGYYGYTQQDIMYDVDKAIDVATRCTLEFQVDGKIAAGAFMARTGDILDFKLFSWPGHGVSADSGVQFNEGEYMYADEYDAFIDDPVDFWWRTYLPRIVGVLEPLNQLPTPTFHYNSIPANLSRYGLPEVQEALEKLVEAGRQTLSWQQKLAPANKKLSEMGFPSLQEGSSSAPYDIVGDALRGTRGISMDVFRQPDKLLKAMDRITPMLINAAVRAARLGGSPVVMMPLHKGADGWLSDEHFKTFYWPSLRKVVLGLIEEGLMPSLFAEGSYDSRLEVIADLPKGKTNWYFDYTDMTRAKEILGDVACIQGNVPVSLIHTGTPEATTAYCRQLIDTAGKGGGFILSTGAGIDRTAKVENVRAMIKTAKEYGVYS